jgi:hypothetical protein
MTGLRLAGIRPEGLGMAPDKLNYLIALRVMTLVGYSQALLPADSDPLERCRARQDIFAWSRLVK